MSLRNNQLLGALSSEPEFSSPRRERECQERRERRGFWESVWQRMTQTLLTGSGAALRLSPIFQPGCRASVSRAVRGAGPVISEGGRGFPGGPVTHAPASEGGAPEVSARRGWGKGGCGRRAGEQFPSVRPAGNVFDLRAVAAREGGAPDKGRGSQSARGPVQSPFLVFRTLGISCCNW